MADRQSPTPGEITIMAAGAVMIIFSFLHFAGDRSAWGSGLFPIATLLPLYGLVMALQIALTKFASRQPARRRCSASPGSRCTWRSAPWPR